MMTNEALRTTKLAAVAARTKSSLVADLLAAAAVAFAWTGAVVAFVAM